MKKKIKLGVIFPNNSIQKKANAGQFNDLQKNLDDFEVKKYKFDSKGKEKILNDFKSGGLDVILKNAYGRMHEIAMEIFLEKNKIPYLGSGVEATLNGTSKFLSKKIFLKNNLPVAKGMLIRKLELSKSLEIEIKRIEKNISYPLMLKDVIGTESKGIFFIKNRNEFIKFLKKIIYNTKEYIAEEFIENNIETTVMVVGNNNPIAYEPVMIVKKRKYISNKDKNNFFVDFNIPLKLPEKIIKKIKKVAVGAHKALKCKTFSRADILFNNGNLYLLEVDVHPGFRMISSTILSAKFKGESVNSLFLKFYKLINKKV